MSPGRHDKIEVGRIDKGGFEDEDTAENIGCSLCVGAVPFGGSAQHHKLKIRYYTFILSC